MGIYNLNDEYKRDKAKDKAIDITEREPLDKKYNQVEGGIYSPRFGTDLNDKNAYKERYSCHCKRLIGKSLSGEICPTCNTEVKFIDVDMELYGYMNLERQCLINPIMYEKLIVYFGKDILEDTLKCKYDLDEDGGISVSEDVKFKHENWEYNGVGMIGFRRDFDEIVERAYKKNKRDKYEEIKRNRNAIFTKHIPIFPLKLRPINIGDTIYNKKINTEYTILNKHIMTINDIELNQVTNNIVYLEKYLLKAQHKLQDITAMIIDMCKGKAGAIRGDILSGRVDYSARNVIVPLTDNLSINEVHLPYLTFLEVFNKELTNLIVRMYGKTYKEASYQLNLAKLDFDRVVYQLMIYMISKYVDRYGGIPILVNRNPTVANPGSMLCLVVSHVEPKYDNYCMAISIDVLTGFNADFE